ncbi:uncharacterized protein LOC141890395 [Acropora palmata]|uniref:uncharacterized protein LOC141890395 n=1 Tax=Acropora palmata TaxID=6131 RepID=UPI003DA0B055
MYAFFLIAILVTICQLVDTTPAQQCPAFGSAFSIMGWMLQRHVYKTMLVDIGLRCLMVCRTDDRCQSFNFVMSHHMCEFNDRVKEARPEDFIPDPDRYYFRKPLNRVPLGSTAALTAVSCKEIKMSEGEAISGKYWLTSLKSGIPVLAFCDMITEDVNECTAFSSICHANAFCNNTVGSYRCTCNPGYAGDGETCTDVNECADSSFVCHKDALCSNSPGSYNCTCKPGYTGNGKTCTDVDECAASSPVCHADALCSNSPGSYHCTCKAGYTGNGKTCTDVDECAAPSPVCHAEALCNNSPGSYHCTCKPEYNGNGKACAVCSNVTTNGSRGRFGVIQQFTVPRTGSYRIKAWGARGGTHSYNYGYKPGTYYGGNGSFIEGVFTLTGGTILNIVVGQRGGDSVEVKGGTATNKSAAQLGLSLEDNAGTGGGGGSFVYTTGNMLLLAAGGGGGASSGYHGVDGQASTNGTRSVGRDLPECREGGTDGYPGQCNSAGGNYHGGVGAGWLAQGCARLGSSHGERGGSREQGWVGGQAGSMNSGKNGGPPPGAVGGFGGGGGGSEDNGASGGGGGYSGGGSGTHDSQAGGGGGSYCSGSGCYGISGDNPNDDGLVQIFNLSN